MKLAGLFPTALVPFQSDGTIAERDFIVQLQHLARAGLGVGGVIVNDPDGDAAGLTDAERERVVELAASAAPTGFPVIATVQEQEQEPASATRAIARLAELGVEAALVSAPGQMSPGAGSDVDAEALAHFQALADAAALPIVVAQGTVGSATCLSSSTLAQLAGLDGVIAVVDRTGDPDRYAEDYAAIDHAVPVLAAADAPVLGELLARGAEGAVTTAANIATRAWADYVAAATNGGSEQARTWFESVGGPLLTAVGSGGSDADGGSASVKDALVELGLLANAFVRPPQHPVEAEQAAVIREALLASGLLVAQ